MEWDEIQWKKGRGKAKHYYSYKEISMVVGLSEGTLRNLVSKGKFKLNDFKSVMEFICSRMR